MGGYGAGSIHLLPLPRRHAAPKDLNRQVLPNPPQRGHHVNIIIVQTRPNKVPLIHHRGRPLPRPRLLLKVENIHPMRLLASQDERPAVVHQALEVASHVGVNGGLVALDADFVPRGGGGGQGGVFGGRAGEVDAVYDVHLLVAGGGEDPEGVVIDGAVLARNEGGEKAAPAEEDRLVLKTLLSFDSCYMKV